MARAASSWSLYLLRCGDGSLYTGIATDVERRLGEHRSHAPSKGAKYLRGRGPLTLEFQREIGARGLALRAEAAIKRLKREEKEALIQEPAKVDPLIALLQATIEQETRRSDSP